MIQRVILHAGFHKTGSSSLQDSLVTHAAALGPDLRIATRKTSAALARASDQARSWSITRDAEATAALATALGDWTGELQLAPGQVLLASSEDFAGHMPGGHGLTDYSAAPAIARALVKALQTRFGAGLEMQFLYTTRAPEPWLRSIHWQLARNPMLGLSARKFLRRYAKAAEFAPLMAKIRAAVPGTHVTEIPLETLACRRLGPVEAIYDLAGLDACRRAALSALPAANSRPPHDLADAFVALNRAGIAAPVLARMKAALIAQSAAASGEAAKSLPSPPAPR